MYVVININHMHHLFNVSKNRFLFIIVMEDNIFIILLYCGIMCMIGFELDKN